MFAHVADADLIRAVTIADAVGVSASLIKQRARKGRYATVRTASGALRIIRTSALSQHFELITSPIRQAITDARSSDQLPRLVAFLAAELRDIEAEVQP